MRGRIAACLANAKGIRETSRRYNGNVVNRHSRPALRADRQYLPPPTTHRIAGFRDFPRGTKVAETTVPPSSG
jgi:hypothetical protein